MHWSLAGPQRKSFSLYSARASVSSAQIYNNNLSARSLITDNIFGAAGGTTNPDNFFQVAADSSFATPTVRSAKSMPAKPSTTGNTVDVQA